MQSSSNKIIKSLLSQESRRFIKTLAEAKEHLAPAVAKFNDIVATKAEGCYVYDSNGQRHLDFTSGIGVLSTGHCHPKIVKAIQDQASSVIFAQQNILPATPATLQLIERLLKICPSNLTRYFFCNSGSEAVDNAIKLARAYTGRQNIISFMGGYHGRTFGSMAVTTSKTIYRQFFGPLIPGVSIAPYPYCLHCTTRTAAGGLNYDVAPCIPSLGSHPYEDRQCCFVPLDDLQMMLKMQTHPKETAAILIEPIMGEGGFLVPPPGYLSALRKICDEHDILLIFDEVQCGAGRTGAWWGHTLLTDVQPDIMIFAKGIASGFPFAGLATRDDLFDHMDPGTMGGTFGGSAMGCAAAVATIDVVEEEKLLQNTTDRGVQLMKGLVELSRKYPGVISDVRGRGLMVAVEFSTASEDGEIDEKAKGVASRMVKAAAERNLLILTAGARETVRFLPPLVVDEGQIDHALNVFEDCLKEVVMGG